MPQMVQNNVKYPHVVNINQQSQNQQRPSMTLLPPQQQFLNQNNQHQDRYVSPMIIKVDSPTKRPSSNFGQFPQQQQLSQFNQQSQFKQQVPVQQIQQQQIP
jgi:hypothetical protein